MKMIFHRSRCPSSAISTDTSIPEILFIFELDCCLNAVVGSGGPEDMNILRVDVGVDNADSGAAEAGKVTR